MNVLYVSDLDGTLLTKDAKLNETTIRIINDLIAQGMNFTFATARSMNSAAIATAGLHLKTPLILYNGAFILDPLQQQFLYSRFFKPSDATRILQHLLNNGQYPFVYAFIDGKERVSYLKDKLHEGGLYYLNNRQNDARFRCVDNVDDLYEGDIFYITCIHRKDFLNPLYETFMKLNIAQIVFHQEIYREEYWLEFMPLGVSKADAILKLKSLGNFDRIVSFGDAINDLAMFSISDECYAVENAVLPLKQRATAVLKSNQEDAVAKWLLEHVKI